jgi:hypothetical protein
MPLDPIDPGALYSVDGGSVNGMIAAVSVLNERTRPMTGPESDDRGATDEPDPRARLMQEVAEQMDAIETDFGDNYEIGRVITIVEVKGPDGSVGLRVRSGQYPWVAIGMLDWAKKTLESAAGDSGPPE